jgi:thiamine-phosphate pyrophosphorylase
MASAKRAVAHRVDFIQIREKDLSTRELVDLVCRIRDLAAGSQTRILVNDRLDIALTAGIDGVHLPGNGLPAVRVRPLVSVLGVSTHSLEEALHAEKANADFIVFGPVFETPGKTAVGLERLRIVTSQVHVPLLAIGGITAANVPSILEAGASGFAAIRMFQD